MRKLFITLICILAISSPFFFVFAQQEVQLLEPSALGSEVSATPDFQTYVQAAFKQILIISAVLAVLMIIIGGLQYILSFSGSSKEEGRKRMTYAVGGLILALAAWLILNTINGSLTNINFSLEPLPAPVDTMRTSLVYHPAGNSDPNATDRVDFTSQEQCLQYVRSRIASGLTDVSEENCRPSSETSGDRTSGGQAARQVCLQQGYTECGFYQTKPDAHWEQTTNTACEGREFISGQSSLLCYGKPHENQDDTYYLLGKKNNQICFDGPYENEDACGVVAGDYSSLRLDPNISPDCVSYDAFKSQYSDKPTCESIADPGQVTTAATASAWDDWSYDPGIGRQKGDAAPALQNLLLCMRSKIANPAVGRISSISDSRYIGNLGVCSNSQCGGNGCQHSCRSCHYGGGTGLGKSLAVDFGDQENKAAIMQAARDCGVQDSRIIDEGNHVHVSANECPR